MTSKIIRAFEESLIQLNANKALRALVHEGDISELTNGILKSNPELFDTLKRIFEDAYIEAKNNNKIDNLDSIPNLVPTDLPWYWS